MTKTSHRLFEQPVQPGGPRLWPGVSSKMQALCLVWIACECFPRLFRLGAGPCLCSSVAKDQLQFRWLVLPLHFARRGPPSDHDYYLCLQIVLWLSVRWPWTNLPAWLDSFHSTIEKVGCPFQSMYVGWVVPWSCLPESTLPCSLLVFVPPDLAYSSYLTTFHYLIVKIHAE